MNRGGSIVSVCWFSTLLLLPGFSYSQESAKDIPIRVVEAASARPVPAARIDIAAAGTSRAVATTDQSGRSVLARSLGTGVLTVKAPGFAPSRRFWPPAPGSAETIVSLVRGATLFVRIVDSATATPVAGSVGVSLDYPGNPSTHSAPADRGYAEFVDLPPAGGAVTVMGVGFAPIVRQIVLQPGSSAFEEFRLQREGIVAGRVVDGKGVPVAMARVVVMYRPTLRAGASLAALVGGRTVTRPDGTFRLTGLLPDVAFAVLAASDLGRAQPVRLLVREGQTLTNVTLVMP